jgi:hypothetical protein
MSMARTTLRPLTFEKKLTSYALAGGAALALPSLANAATITLSAADGETKTVDWNVDGVGLPEFTFTADGEAEFRSVSVAAFPGSSNLIFGDFDGMTTLYVHAFGPGEPIEGPTIPSGIFIADKKHPVTKDSIGLKGEWAENDIDLFKIMGFQFVTGGVTYRGWAEVAVHLGSADLIVDDFAFVAVPEPGTMGLLLLGAAGVAEMRRRRA